MQYTEEYDLNEYFCIISYYSLYFYKIYILRKEKSLYEEKNIYCFGSCLFNCSNYSNRLLGSFSTLYNNIVG